MKKLIVVACSIVTMIIMMAHSDGIGDRTNSPSETTCTSCHTSFPLNSGTGSVSITDNIPLTGYVPGQTYTINVTVAKSGVPLFGFDFEALTPTNTTAGNITITNPASTKIIIPTTRQNVTHTKNGGLTANSKTFTFNWTAPATNIGNITFYAAGNAANNNGSNSGDFIYTTSKVIPATGTGLTLNLTALLEGLYTATTNTMISDVVTVELRNSTAPYALVSSKTGVTLSTTGNAILTFPAGSSGVNYYIVVKHRNSIETWSATAVPFVSGSLTYNFTTGVNKAFGNNMILKGGKACIYSGDIDQNGSVDGNDMTPIDNDSFVWLTGYVVSDLNGDLSVDGNDMTFVDNNSANWVAVAKPN